MKIKIQAKTKEKEYVSIMFMSPEMCVFEKSLIFASR